MPEKPHKQLLDRDFYSQQVADQFSEQLKLLQDVTNYGSNLIVAAFASSKKDVADVMILTVLLKQVVSMLDAVEVLISSACVPISQLPSRAMFEASVQIDFILSGDEVNKARHFYVSNLRRELLWNFRCLPDTEHHAHFNSNLGGFQAEMDEISVGNREEARRRAEEIQLFLDGDPWRQINRRLEAECIKRKQAYEVSWYVPFGSRTLRDLCKHVSRMSEYKVFYSASSEKAHGVEYRSHVSFSSGQVAIGPIRNLSEIGTAIL